MPRFNLTLAQHEDALGLPIILLIAIDRTTGKPMQLTVRDLPLTAIAQIVQWLNDRLSTG
jgi:hypothetical protein